MTRQARDIVVTGRVQGVGYRPFVFVTAQELGLTGTVLNGSGKVLIHAEGTTAALDRLEHALVHAAPPLARPRLASSETVDCTGATQFEILASDAATEAEIHVPPDLFTCDDCLAELTDPAQRRFGYPFINCTQCGPRYTIITAMPYDRPNTSMADFPLCDDCRAEYLSPADRRFHAQPLACPVCGPQLQFVPADRRAAVGAGLHSGPEREPSQTTSAPTDMRCRTEPCSGSDVNHPGHASALRQAVTAINDGKVVAIKGVGGYHLVCDAASDAAVQRLRARKQRPHKPLAVMFPLRGADGLDAVREQLDLDELAAAALSDPARPIVLARKGRGFDLSPAVAPGLAELGAFLPYSPLHHELLAVFGRPLVATSGNISGEPVITDNAQADQRLGAIVDAFLHHDRPIVRPADDPVLRPMAGAARAIRLGRGIAPLERELPRPLPYPLLATGGHMKVTVALAWARRVVVSPHIGDLDSPRSNEIFKNIINELQNLYNVKSHAIVCDLHPGYSSTRWAMRQGVETLRVQHHAAHASALAGEHPDVDDWLVFAWDGVGYGSDGTLWGGEALAGRPGQWRRRGSFRPFQLVGGDKAGREPWRSAAALLWERGLDLPAGLFEGRTAACSGIPAAGPEQGSFLQVAHEAWRKRINTFETTAVGRLFDAAAALILGRSMASFEGQGPMELEHAAASGGEAIALPLEADADGLLRSDWAPLLDPLTDTGIAQSERAALFHESLAQAVVDQALEIRKQFAFEAVGLSGGVFQNRRLTESVIARLGAAGIDARLHRELPANDGGLCFGQVIEAMALL
jgi:hydrogenase maturation protein HypF